MIRLELPRPKKGPLRVLCLGAHSDDIEIGCGGTLLHLLARRKSVAIDWIVFSGDAVRAAEARASARRLVGVGEGAATSGAGSRPRIETKSFRDGFFPSQQVAIKEEFEKLKRRPAPDLVFCPWRGDAHQDHRVLAELAWNTFRDHYILEYEVPKYDGDLGSPNVYVPLEEKTARRKVEHLMQAFPSQAGNQWYTEETFRAVLRLRGIECNAESGLAEGFYARKTVLG
jgi:LmbE family N-acetylglucosaminyl deacetylase